MGRSYWAGILLGRTAHTASLISVRLGIFQRGGNVTPGEIAAGCPVVLLAGLRDVDGLLSLLGVWGWRGSLRRNGRWSAAQCDHEQNERE